MVEIEDEFGTLSSPTDERGSKRRHGRWQPLPASRPGGPVVISALVVGMAALWIALRPAGIQLGSYLGQLIGAESVVLLSIALVLVSTVPWVEGWFDGVDRAMIWHRRLAITGVVLLVPHILTATNQHPSGIGPALGVLGLLGLLALAGWAILPRWRSVIPGAFRGLVGAVSASPVGSLVRWVVGGYERWRLFHRATGMFVAFGFVHGLLDATPFQAAPLLRWSYVAIGGIGLAFYLYRELVARHLKVLHDYEVDSVRPLADGVTEITLQPLDRPMDFQPGQWMMLYVEGRDGWHRHPFTISSAPHEPLLRVTVKALGDYTERAHQLEPGMPAVVSAPMGRFDYRFGGESQLWIAGGIGITPFLSWLRDADHRNLPLPHIDFFYSTPGPAAFSEELGAIAERHPSLRLHLNDTTVQPRLNGETMLAATVAEAEKLSVFMCGPTAMLRDLRRQLKSAGVPAGRLRYEYFDWR
jgi:predicted ferric reductase